MSEERSRSVNDFDTTEGLKAALRSQEKRASFSDTGHDFPRSLVGSSVELDDDASSDGGSLIGDLDGDLDWVLTNYNAEISQSQSLTAELKRLQVLRSYLLLDSERESSFERLTALAARMFRVPIALVSLVDLGRQWFMSNRGLGDVRETPRKLAFCAHAILSNQDLLIVPDASQDSRFSENPLVTGPPHIRFYAGAPLMCPEGFKLGTFCIIDDKPRHSGLSLEEKQNLRELAALAVDAMAVRKREKQSILEDKSQIIACTAHDLLTPLSGVQMSLSLLLDDEELQQRLSAPQKELIVTAGSCTNVMNRICQHAIESFRGEQQQQQQPTPQEENGHIAIADLVKNLQMVMEPYPKTVPLYITVDPMVPPVIISDDLKIFRSAINLLTNACKKTTRGSVQLRLYVAGKRKKPKLVVECKDTGPGVPLNHYQHLFRPFREDMADDACFQLDAEGKVSGGVCQTMNNSGLGLYSVASQISSIGGEYGFRPRPEGGAMFWFSVPLRVPQEDGNNVNGESSSRRVSFSNDLNAARSAETVQLTRQAETLAQRIHDLSASMSDSKLSELGKEKDVVGKETDAAMENAVSVPKEQRTRRALVIDDSIVIRKTMSRGLSKLGFEVMTATNGMEGLKELQSGVFDLVLCDYLMPVMDGLDCVQQYRDWEAIHRPWIHHYIVGISAHASPKDVEKGFAAGMDDFRSKPVTLQVLKELETSFKLKQVSEVLDNVLDVRKHTIDRIGSQEKQMDSDKRQKVTENDEVAEKVGPVCLVGEGTPSVSKSMVQIVEARHWNPVVVSDGEDALRLLKIRNWHAVFLDEEMPRLDGIRCIARFREWESENRVARQNNIFLVSESFVPNPSDGSVSATYPTGFDGALGKPILPADLVKLLNVAAMRITTLSDSSDIVTR